MKFLLILIPLLISAETIQIEKIEVNASLYTPISEYRYDKVDFSAIGTKMNIQQTTPGSYSPVIRGLQGELVGVKFEDISLNNSNFRSGPNQYFSWIPNEFVEYNIEPGNAIGLSVDSHLKDTKEAYIEYSSYDDGRKFVITDKFGNTKVGLKLYKTGEYNDIEHTSYNQNSGYIENVTGKNKFTALYSTNSNIDRLDKFIQNKTYTYLDQDYLFIKDAYKITKEDKIIGSYQRFVENVEDNGKYIDSTNNVYGAKYYHSFSNGLRIGISDSYEDLMYNHKDFMFNTVDLNARYKTEIDGYKIKLSGSKVYMQTEDEQSSIDKNFDVYSFNSEIQKGYIYGGFRVGYKLPTANNLYYSRTTGKGTDVENPDLKPQESRTYTLGLRNETDEFTFDLAWYYSYLYNAIASVKTGTISGVDQYQAQNVGDGVVKGVDATATYEDGLFGSVFNFQYVYGKDDSDYMNKITPWKIFWKNEYNHFFVTWNYAHKGIHLSTNDMSDVRIINSTYNQYNNKGVNTFDVGYYNDYKEFTYAITMNNITGNDGRVMGSSVDVPERSITVRLGYKF